MKNPGVFAALIAVSASCSAQDKQVLLDACAAVKDAEKRANCFEQIARLGPPGPVASAGQAQSPEEKLKARYIPVARALTALESALNTTVNYQQYVPLVHALATEVSLAGASPANEAEARSISQFQEMVNAYADAAKWWQADINFYAQRNNRLSYGFGLPFNMVGLDGLVDKYRLPIGKADLLGIQRGVPTSLALRSIWDSANRSAQRAMDLLQIAAKEPLAVVKVAVPADAASQPAMSGYAPSLPAAQAAPQQ